MTDYFGVFLAGMSTGAGVIVASKVIAFLERHPIIVMFRRQAEDLTGLKPGRRGRT